MRLERLCRKIRHQRSNYEMPKHQPPQNIANERTPVCKPEGRGIHVPNTQSRTWAFVLKFLPATPVILNNEIVVLRIELLTTRQAIPGVAVLIDSESHCTKGISAIHRKGP